MKSILPAIYRLNPSSLVFDVSDDLVAFYMNIKAFSDLAYRTQKEIEAAEVAQEVDRIAVCTVSDGELLKMSRATTAILINYEKMQEALGESVSIAEIEYVTFAEQMLTEALPLLMGGLNVLNNFTIDSPSVLKHFITLINQSEDAARKIQSRFDERHGMYHQLAEFLSACLLLRAKLMGRPFLPIGGRLARQFTPEDVH